MNIQSYFKLLATSLLFLVVVIMRPTSIFAQEAMSFSSGATPIGAEALSSSPAEEQLSTSIPFTQDALFPQIIVLVKINGQAPLPFMVDTGLDQPIFIEKWAADQLRLVPSKEYLTLLPGNHTFPITTLQSILLMSNTGASNIEYQSYPACIGKIGLPSSNDQRIAGVLGLPLFSNLVMQLDFQQHLINFSQHLDRSRLEPNSLSLSLLQPDQTKVQFFAAWPVQSSTLVTTATNQMGNKQTITKTTTIADNLLIDTGANTSSFSAAIVSYLHPEAMGTEPVLSIVGESQTNNVLLPKFAIGEYIIPDLIVRCPTVQRTALEADALGLDILKHFRVTLDFPNKQLYLDKFDHQPVTDLPSTTGVQLKKQGSDFFVDRILPRSPAEKTVLQVGDKITSIDGISLAADSHGLAQEILDGNAGTNAKLLVTSANMNRKQISIPRITLYDTSLYPAYGFLIQKKLSDQTIIVRYILCSSTAWKAGIRAGDVIKAINGTPVKTTDQVRALLERWPQKAMPLTIQRDDKPQSIILDNTPAVH